MSEARLASQPRDVTRMRDLAVALAAHADILAGVGHRAQACAAARRGIALLDALARTGDLSVRDRRQEYAKLNPARARYCG